MKMTLAIFLMMVTGQVLALGAPRLNPGQTGLAPNMGHSLSTLNQIHQDPEDKLEINDSKKRQEQEESRFDEPSSTKPLKKKDRDFNKNE